MKNYNYDRNNVYKDFERLPKGGYVLKILQVKYEEGQNGKRSSGAVLSRYGVRRTTDRRRMAGHRKPSTLALRLSRTVTPASGLTEYMRKP